MKRDNASKTYNIPRNIVTLPESSELERAVLGALILEPGYLPDVMEIVDKTAFYVTTNASIFSVMQAMFADGCKIDLYTLSQRCKDTPGVEISLAYLAGLTQTVGSGANCIDHARQLKELDNRRRFIMLGYEIATRASIGANSTDDITEWITRQVDGIAANSASTNDLTPLSDAVHNTLQNIEQRQRALQAGECIGILRGWNALTPLREVGGADSLSCWPDGPRWEKVRRCSILPELQQQVFRCASFLSKCRTVN